MGKSKQKRFSCPKTSPTGLQSVKEFEEEQENMGELAEQFSVGESVITNIIEQLHSTNEEDRDCGCNTISGLVAEPNAIPLLMKHDMIKIIAPLLVDPNDQIQKSSSGALRNMSVEGGDSVCQSMLDNDVMTAVVQFIRKFDVSGLSDKKQVELKLSVADNVVQLLWNLCESCRKGLDIFNKEELIKNILPFLRYTEYGYPLAISAAQCIHAVSEDNKHVEQYCMTDESRSLLQSICESTANSTHHALLKTLVTGILLNVFGSSLASSPAGLISAMTASISEVLSVDAAAMFQAKIQEISNNSVPNIEDEGFSLDIFKGELDDKLSEVDNLLLAQLIAVQTAANICCSDDDEEWEELDEESVSSDDVGNDAEMDENTETNFSPMFVPTELNNAIAQSDIIPKVLSKITADSFSVSEDLRKFNKVKKINNQMLQLEIHALLCVNNLLSAMDMDGVLDMDKLHSLWDRLIQISTCSKAQESTEFLEASMSAMRAVMEKLAANDSPKFSNVTSEDIQFIYNLAKNSSSREVRVHSVKIVSTIGCLLAKNKQLNPLLTVIATFLIEVSCCDTDLWVVAEALDSIFDVFGEDHLDPIVKDTYMITKLKSILSTFKSKMSSARKSLGEHYPVVKTARDNLRAFIKYKTDHVG